MLAFSELQVYAKPNGPSATEGGGGGGGATAAQLRPGLNKAVGRQRVKNKRVRYKVRCVRATAGTLPATCRMTLTLGKLGKKTFSAKPGKYKTVTFKLKARDLKRLNKKRSIRTRLTGSVRNPGAATRKAHRTVRILQGEEAEALTTWPRPPARRKHLAWRLAGVALRRPVRQSPLECTITSASMSRLPRPPRSGPPRRRPCPPRSRCSG